jgi:hypothetical protein
MKNITDTALVVSLGDDVNQGTARINLRWNGDPKIADFNLDRLGKVPSCETETEDTDWAIIEHPPPRTDDSFAKRDRMIEQTPERPVGRNGRPELVFYASSKLNLRYERPCLLIPPLKS